MTILQILQLICWLLAATVFSPVQAFVLAPQQSVPRIRRADSTTATKTTILHMIQRGTPGRSAPRGKNDKSKRQYRVGELVRTELARMLHTGHIKNGESFLEDDLRSRISIVSVDVSPGLRQARVSVSIRGNPKNSNSADSTVDKRRAYSWLVDNTKGIRHTLAQRMSHIKTSPALTFVQVDVAAAVDVMYLIDKVSSGSYERETIGEFGGNDDNLPRGYVPADEFDDDDD